MITPRFHFRGTNASNLQQHHELCVCLAAMCFRMVWLALISHPLQWFVNHTRQPLVWYSKLASPSLPALAHHQQQAGLQIDRKLVKQTVMTSVYGVTFLGAKDQIANRLKERHWSSDDKLITDTAIYLARVCFQLSDRC